VTDAARTLDGGAFGTDRPVAAQPAGAALPPEPDGPLVRVEDLRVEFPVRGGKRLPDGSKPVVHAVDGVSFDVHRGEVLALVGESGCGKTTIAKTMVRLIDPTGGRIEYRGSDITRVRGADLRRLRERFQLVFQDPYESLDPRQTVHEIVEEPLLIHGRGRDAAERTRLVFAALEGAGLHPAAEIAARYPHHLSGGQRQRVAIAAAMVLEPELIVADEPVSMLDVSFRAEILSLMLDLRAQRSFTYLFITHDLSLAWVIADRIAVVYLGRIVEIGTADDVIQRPQHPYTRALVSVIPVPEPGAESDQIVLTGEAPSPSAVPAGCRFHPRCWLRRDLGDPEACTAVDPTLAPAGPGRVVACHFPEGGPTP
jgi:oligopeptide/dipeptide ABC transporter ATP-binding protein